MAGKMVGVENEESAYIQIGCGNEWEEEEIV